MYTLYYAPGACSMSVHIVLEWIGAPYRAERTDPSSGDYLAVNPAGAVPALRIGEGAPLTQCSAILHFLARRFPQADLGDDATPERAAEVDRWAAFLTGDLHPVFFPVFMPARYTTDPDKAALAKVREAGLALVRKKLGLIDGQLEGREHFVGGKRTIVDAYSVPMVRWASSILPGGLAAYPNVGRHHERMLADPAVHKVMQAKGLTEG